MWQGGLAALVAALAMPCVAQETEPAFAEVIYADLVQPTDRYDHGVLGDALEWGGMLLTLNTCRNCAGLRLAKREITLPATRVFEDTEARVADLDGDGLAEVVVVETDLSLGASLAVYGPRGKLAATGFIGQTHRWLAPAGIADLDGDGQVEIAYVDRPHLIAELVILQYADGQLSEVARLSGLTNHRIGDPAISGGVRDCGNGPELVLLSKDWQQMQTVRYAGKVLSAQPLGGNAPGAIGRALRCED